jgi:hypothetical protein
MCCDLRGGVVGHAACWIPFVRVAFASSMWIVDFSGVCVSIRSSRITRKASQYVYLLCSDGFCYFVGIRVCMVTVWSDESSRQESISNLYTFVPFVMQKCKKSGCLFVSLGQNVGWHVDIYSKLLLKALCSSLPLVVVILAPHDVCFAMNLCPSIWKSIV